MHRVLPASATLVAALLLCAATAAAQDTTIAIHYGQERQGHGLLVRQLPREVADEAVRFFNAPGTMHMTGPARIPAARGVDGDLAVLGGPVTIAGRVSGSLLVVNGDLVFEHGAQVGGNVTVVGGSIVSADQADVAGESHEWRDPLRYRRYGEEIAYAPDRLPAWARRVTYDYRDGSHSDFLLALGGTYNRVEGAPIDFGPRLDTRLGDNLRLRTELIGVLRTGRDFSVQSGDFGYRATGELVVGSRGANVGFGARGFDLVESVEPWPLKDYEAGWAAFLLHRDYRDYFRRQGGALYAALRPNDRFTFTAEGVAERQVDIDARDPWTLFNRGQVAWRANPGISAGDYRSLTGALRYDSRNEHVAPSSGVLVTAELEIGRGTGIDSVPPACPSTAPACAELAAAGGTLSYRRLFVDARTYLRTSPNGRLNLRLAGGGWLGGDPLPLQRRLSLGAPDPLPGYDFRAASCGGGDVMALCDRALVVQAEYRTHLGFDFGPEWANDWGGGADDYEPFHVTGPDVVVFGDAGQAWMVGNAPGEIPAGSLPTLRHFRADLGLGIDFGPLGFYLARAVDTGSHPVTFTVRMGRRF